MHEQSDLISLGERIRNLRGKESREQFAKSFLAKPSTLARWEAGESQPELGFLIRLASAFGVSFEWLVSGIGDFPKNGRIRADQQFRYLDDLDWAKAKRDSAATGLLPKESELHKPDVRDEYIACLRQLADVQKENGDLRVEAAELRAKNAELERRLAEALKPAQPAPMGNGISRVG